MNSLEGLKNSLAKDCDANKLASLQLILNQLEKAIKATNEPIKFISCALLIHEEFKLLLSDNPYQAKDYQENLSAAFPYPNNQPTFGYASGGMAALTKCLNIARDMEGNIYQPLFECLNKYGSINTNTFFESNVRNFIKKSNLRKPLTILFANDTHNYYENESLLRSEFDRSCKVKNLEGKNLDKIKKYTYDTVVFTMDPICSDTEICYTPINIPLLIQKLNQNGMLAKNATLICDVTTSTLNHPKLHEFINFIEEKKLPLNIIAYTSAAKLISLGFDNLQSSILMLITSKYSTNKNNLTSHIKATLHQHINTPDFQYLNHMINNCYKIIDDYIQQYTLNTRFILNAIEKNDLLYKPDEFQDHVFVANVSKDINYYPYIDIIYDNQKNLERLLKYLHDQTVQANLYMENRGSFGFAIPTFSSIKEDIIIKTSEHNIEAGGKIRLSPGLLPQNKLVQFTQLLIKSMKYINQLKEDRNQPCFRYIIKN